ncbi:hypothetical protein [Mesorhizobium loti]|uniref:Uncharacterized protein n=1 Tax=Mesorhizobium loti R88b TaxID=935548 RepID=A0A6M7WQD0_RHILI|nr:hypothetical protein [Mesorhizobium loti]QKD04255.1 hypothetical protein EB235_24530 [Mesorhizobium loti R88b]
MLRIFLAVAAFAVFCDGAIAEERSCEAIGALLAGTGNCQDGDVVKIGSVDADDVPEMVQTYCDFGSQILTLPDRAIASQIAGQPQYVVLCKYHRRPAAPSK